MRNPNRVNSTVAQGQLHGRGEEDIEAHAADGQRKGERDAWRARLVRGIAAGVEGEEAAMLGRAHWVPPLVLSRVGAMHHVTSDAPRVVPHVYSIAQEGGQLGVLCLPGCRLIMSAHDIVHVLLAGVDFIPVDVGHERAPLCMHPLAGGRAPCAAACSRGADSSKTECGKYQG